MICEGMEACMRKFDEIEINNFLDDRICEELELRDSDCTRIRQHIDAGHVLNNDMETVPNEYTIRKWQHKETKKRYTEEFWSEQKLIKLRNMVNEPKLYTDTKLEKTMRISYSNVLQLQM